MKNRLKVLRAERDWSQAQLADFLDVSRQTINALETGKYDPSLPLAFKIAALFSLKIEDIFLANPIEKKENDKKQYPASGFFRAGLFFNSSC